MKDLQLIYPSFWMRQLIYTSCMEKRRHLKFTLYSINQQTLGIRHSEFSRISIQHHPPPLHNQTVCACQTRKNWHDPGNVIIERLSIRLSILLPPPFATQLALTITNAPTNFIPIPADMLYPATVEEPRVLQVEHQKPNWSIDWWPLEKSFLVSEQDQSDGCFS